MLLPKLIFRSNQPFQNGKGWLQYFKRTMSGAKNEQSIKFDPIQGATKSAKPTPTPTPTKIPIVSYFSVGGGIYFSFEKILF